MRFLSYSNHSSLFPVLVPALTGSLLQGYTAQEHGSPLPIHSSQTQWSHRAKSFRPLPVGEKASRVIACSD